MKCQTCKFNHICSGRIDESVGEHCKRYKSIVQTNEEWFCSLPTEKKAKLLRKNFDCFYCPIERKNCHGLIENCEKTIMEWLKEVHKE